MTARFDAVMRPAVSKSLTRLPMLVRRAMAVTWRAAPREFATSALLQAAGALALPGQVLAARWLLERLFTAQASPWPPLALFTVVSVIASVAAVLRAEQQRILAGLVGRHAEGLVLSKATSVDLLAFEDPSFYDRLQRARVNAVLRPVQVASGVLGLLSGTVAVVGLVGVLALLQPVVLAVALVAFLPGWVLTRRASQLLYRFERGQTERDRRRHAMVAVLTERETAAEVRTYGAAEWFHEQHDALYDDRLRELRTVLRRRVWLGLLAAAAAAVTLGATIGVLVMIVDAGRMDLAAAGAAAGAVLLLAQRLNGLSSSGAALYESALFLEDFTSFIAPDDAPRDAGGSTPAPLASLRAVDLWFTYPSRAVPSLRGVSMELKAGEVVALVGENGSGKTTLAKILVGLYPSERGQVLWNGHAVDTLDRATMRDHVAVVFQDFARYDLTVADNIRLGRHTASPAEISQAAERSGADDVVDSLPDGYDTLLGPAFFGGSDLSGGQWQRIALARAFLRDAPLMILDEPTASMDARAEHELFAAIRTLYQGRTVLLISHRFSTVRAADRIYVLHDGEIVESGTHDELAGHGGLYAELYGLQASAYVDSGT